MKVQWCLKFKKRNTTKSHFYKKQFFCIVIHFVWMMAHFHRWFLIFLQACYSLYDILKSQPYEQDYIQQHLIHLLFVYFVEIEKIQNWKDLHRIHKNDINQVKKSYQNFVILLFHFQLFQQLILQMDSFINKSRNKIATYTGKCHFD